MELIEIKMPKMGESMTEATILNWSKQVGDYVEADETLLEIATDKVDSEVAAPSSGILKEVFFESDTVVEVGTILATIETQENTQTKAVKTEASTQKSKLSKTKQPTSKEARQFYSPLVKSISEAENISPTELESISGTGESGRIRKSDLMAYLQNRSQDGSTKLAQQKVVASTAKAPLRGQVVQMDRMRQLIAEHMVKSVQTSPHVTTFAEVDVTNLVNWRNANKTAFFKKHGVKLTFTPLFIEAITKAINDFPMINASVEGNTIRVHEDIHLGMAAALPTGNLIVPVIKDADQKNLLGLAKDVNNLTEKARNNDLNSDDIKGSTFTLSNVGTFGSLMGTPIINQPEVAILATGTIKKRAEVMETENGDVIAIRQMMFLSLSFDHRAVDGLLAGTFLKRVADNLEQFNTQQTI